MVISGWDPFQKPSQFSNDKTLFNFFNVDHDNISHNKLYLYSITITYRYISPMPIYNVVCMSPSLFIYIGTTTKETIQNDFDTIYIVCECLYCIL